MLPVAAPTNCCKSCSSETETDAFQKDLQNKNRTRKAYGK